MMIVVKSKNNLRFLNKNKLRFFFDNKIVFVYLVVNLYLFNLTKSFFNRIGGVNVLVGKNELFLNINNQQKHCFGASSNDAPYLLSPVSRSVFVSSSDLSVLFSFNSFFIDNSSLAMLGVYYHNMYFSFNYFKNLILTFNSNVKKTVSLLLFKSFLKLFFVLRKLVLKL